MSDLEQYNENQQTERPGFLKTLCILSFISIGFAAISGLLSVVSGPQNDEAMLEAKVEMSKSIDQMREMGSTYFVNFFEQMQGMMVDTNDHHAMATGINILITLLGFFAVIRMWHGFRYGFYAYIAYCLAGAFAVYLYVAPNHVPVLFPIVALVFSALFIFLYSRNLHWMQK